MHLGMAECRASFYHCGLDLSPSFKNYCVRRISPIFLEVGIPNLVSRLMYVTMAECGVPFPGHCDLDLCPSF